MSRCFPYMPSGKAVIREASLEPIKLQKETEKKANSLRKKEKRDKKRKGHKEEKVVSSFATVHNAKKFDDKKCLQQEKGKGEANEWYPPKIEDEAEQLERSSITSEHEVPTCSENICYLSDGTQTSNTIGRQTLASCSSNQNRRTIIRIKSLQRHSEPDASLVCSTSGRAYLLSQERTEIVHAPHQARAGTNAESDRLTSKSDQDLSSPTPESIKTIGQKMIAFENTSFKDQSRREDLLLGALFENLDPSLLQDGPNDFGDEEWLFETKQQNRHGSKRYKANNEVSCGASCTLWPQAQLLPEAGLYALPFTVPF